MNGFIYEMIIRYPLTGELTDNRATVLRVMAKMEKWFGRLPHIN